MNEVGEAPLHLLCWGDELPEPTWVIPGLVSDPLEVAKWLLVAHMRRECPHAYVGTVVAMRWVVSAGRAGYRVWALFDDIHNLPLYHIIEQEVTGEAPQQGAAGDPARDGEGSHDGAGCDEARPRRTPIETLSEIAHTGPDSGVVARGPVSYVRGAARVPVCRPEEL